MTIQIKYSPDKAGRLIPAELPLSKSIALRVMTLNALSRLAGGGEAHIPQLPDSEDVAGMERAIKCISEAARQQEVYIGEGGAPLRFFTALAASFPGMDITLLAGESLMRRPLKPLLDALHDAGAKIRCRKKKGFPPLHIEGRELEADRITMTPAISSQFVSALMMAAPLWRTGLRLDFGGVKPVSTPYILMTARIMSRFGIASGIGQDSVTVEPCQVKAPREFEIEPDWSAASYFYELALLLPGTPIPLLRLTPPERSLQGDSRCAEIFSGLGVSTDINPDGSATLLCDGNILKKAVDSRTRMELDMCDTPDLVPALAVGFCMAGVRFRFTGIGHLRHKETDRMLALETELGKAGYDIVTGPDFMEWNGLRSPVGNDYTIDTYSDHRMAMAFAPAAAKRKYISIHAPEVVDKSFPTYWKVLEGLGFETSRPDTPSHKEDYNPTDSDTLC